MEVAASRMGGGGCSPWIHHCLIITLVLGVTAREVEEEWRMKTRGRRKKEKIG
jgi:hypothetical protein